jgi:thiamine pyrophosphokinase
MSANANRSRSSDPSDHVLLVIGGSAPNPRCLRHVAPFERVVCADSGVDHARTLGLTPDLVIGDMDSISDDSRAWAASKGARFEVADRDKDQTDTELALANIASMRLRALTVLWGGGNRIDHVLGVLASVSAPALSSLERLNLWVADDLVHVLHGPRSLELASPIGTTLSLVPLRGPVEGVTTSGLRWNLHDETLHPDRSRGISNVVDGPTRIVIDAGVLAAIIPASALIDPTTEIPTINSEEKP